MSQTQTLEIVEIPVDKIRPSPYQPRLDFDLEELRGSIIKYGIRDPLKVRWVEDHWELIDGERRWRIAKQESMKTVPCLVLNYTDEEADALAWRFNVERKDYSLEEKAKHFKKHQNEGMSARGIANIHGINHVEVSRLLAIFRLPEKYRNYIWTREFSAVNYRYLHEKGLMGSESVTMVTQIIDESVERRLTQREFEKVIDDYIGDLEKKHVEEAKKAAAKIEASKEREGKTREALGEPEVTPPETPEDFERAAKALKKEAERRKTPEQRAEEKRQKLITQARKSLNSLLKKIDGASNIVDVSSFRERFIELERSLEQNPSEVKEQLIALGKEVTEAKKQRQKEIEEEKRKKREEEQRHRLEEEMRRKLEEEKRRIEEEAKAKAREELLRDTEFIREFIKKEYPLMPETIKTENLEKELMQRLIASIPEEKRERAKEIFREEFRSLQKRLDIFPEKSAKIEPKFERLRLLKDRGVIPYTVWDFPYRDDYAGDKEFHGNCSPQIIEQCIWRLTDEGDLVVDPMAGSGTALGVCKKFNRRCIGYDIKPPENRPDIVQNDSRKVPLEDESVDMVFIHPPYWNLTHYTKAEENLPDLSRAKTVEEYSAMIKQVFKECYRILKHGKFMCVLLGDLIRGGRFISLCREATNVAEEIGFMDYGYAVKLAHGEVSRKKSGVIVAEPVYTHNLKISHDLVIFLRKPEHHGD